MEALKRQRAVIKGSMTRIKTFVLTNENVTTVDVTEYETREIFLEKAFEEFCKVQEKIEALEEGEETDRGDVELNYLTILAKIKSKIKTINQLALNVATGGQQSQTHGGSASTSTGAQISARLPSVNIPSFSGKIEDWQAFIDLFLAVIDGHSYLDNVQKFLYLKGALSGEALNLINNLPLTNDNYTQALDLLKNRYENKLAVINAHLKGMLDTPTIAKGTGKQLRAFLTHVRQHVNSLKALKLPVKEWDILLVFLFSQKLDYQTHKAYELEKVIGQRASGTQAVLPTLDDFLSFLESRCLAFENIQTDNSKGFDNQGHGNKDKIGDKHSKNVFFNQLQGQTMKCSFCNKDNHTIQKCYKFTAVPLAEKRQFVQDKRLCYNCLGKSHGVAQCQTKQGCKTCKRKHHTLLHENMSTNHDGSEGGQHINGPNNNSQNNRSQVNAPGNNERGNSPQRQGNTLLGTNQNDFIGISHGRNLGIIGKEENNAEQTVMICSKNTKGQVLLATARIYLVDQDGNRIQARALLDSGSQTSFITTQLFKKLKNVESYKTSFKVGGIGNIINQVNTGVKLTIQSNVGSYQVEAACAVIDKITSKLPHAWVDVDKINIGKDITLADPLYYRPGEIDMLISADLYFKIIFPEIRKLGPGLPILQNSELGWLVCGTAPINFNKGNSVSCCTKVDLFCKCEHLEDVNETIPRFWQLEEFSNKTFLSRDEKLCERLFLDSCKRQENGVFQVDIPMRDKNDYLKLGNSFHTAYRRFQFLEERFRKNPHLFVDYKKFIDEYVELGHGKYVECDSEMIENRAFGEISVNELQQAHQTVIKQIQWESFQKEIEYFRLSGNSKQIFKESNIRCLNPFLDKNGIIRINGRLTLSTDIDFDTKFPILLPSNHYAVKLLIRLEHLKLFHAGSQTVLANLRLKYWIVQGLSKVKSVCRECVICHRFKAKFSTQMMGSLPADRITVARPFLKVGIDFGGPLTVKQSRLRKAVTSKAYIALFVCMVTKAIHIEVVSSLSAEAFIHTFKRFIARRGCPTTVFSDNATNFQGANNFLRDVYLFFKNDQIVSKINNFLIDRKIEWRFIPPVSPHWGGLWEAGIKSTKYHLRRIVGKIILTFEELTTVLAEIEAILNSRPLCPISSDPSDFNCLTPSHFLIGEPLTSIPEKDVSTIPENRLNFLHLCVKIKQNFWKRWSVEYLTRLQNRPKWFNSVKNLEENTIVLLKDDNAPPLQWSLGRIVKVMQGPDGRVRVAEIKTKDGVFTRPITKLSPLPFDSN